MKNTMAKNMPDAKEMKKCSKEAQDSINKIVAAERNKKIENIVATSLRCSSSLIFCRSVKHLPCI